MWLRVVDPVVVFNCTENPPMWLTPGPLIAVDRPRRAEDVPLPDERRCRLGQRGGSGHTGQEKDEKTGRRKHAPRPAHRDYHGPPLGWSSNSTTIPTEIEIYGEEARRGTEDSGKVPPNAVESGVDRPSSTE